MVEALEAIQQTLSKLTNLFPESLVYDDDEEAEEWTIWPTVIWHGPVIEG